MFRKTSLFTVAMTLCLQTGVSAQQPAQPKPSDLTKAIIEMPLKRVISSDPITPALKPSDMTKGIIEMPLKRIISTDLLNVAPSATAPPANAAGATGPAAAVWKASEPSTVRPHSRLADLSKMGIERPLKRIISDSGLTTNGDAKPQTVVAPTLKEERTSHGRVKPGSVKWHDSLKSACAAAHHSGKPVLVFQMMGRLDQEFC